MFTVVYVEFTCLPFMKSILFNKVKVQSIKLYHYASLRNQTLDLSAAGTQRYQHVLLRLPVELQTNLLVAFPISSHEFETQNQNNPSHHTKYVNKSP